MQQLETIAAILSKNHIAVNDNQLLQLNKYYDLVIKYNNEFNITAITELNDFACKHFADSLLGNDIYKKNSTLCDIGTGGGFPGIPLKILRPDLCITLVDSLQKRVNFLNTVIHELGLTNIVAIHSRAQELPQHNVSRETFDYVVSRAVAQLNILSELCLPYVKINGKMIAYKSQNTKNELENATTALNSLGGELSQIIEYNLLTSENEILKRNLIFIKKTKHTPDKYPRQKKKITTNPV